MGDFRIELHARIPLVFIIRNVLKSKCRIDAHRFGDACAQVERCGHITPVVFEILVITDRKSQRAVSALCSEDIVPAGDDGSSEVEVARSDQ